MNIQQDGLKENKLFPNQISNFLMEFFYRSFMNFLGNSKEIGEIEETEKEEKEQKEKKEKKKKQEKQEKQKKQEKQEKEDKKEKEYEGVVEGEGGEGV